MSTLFYLPTLHKQRKVKVLTLKKENASMNWLTLLEEAGEFATVQTVTNTKKNTYSIMEQNKSIENRQMK